MTGFVKMVRGLDHDELIAKNWGAAILANVIARRARWHDGPNVNGLQVGEALLGDCAGHGFTQRQYRTAKQVLKAAGFATFRATSRGTIARLTDTRLYDVAPAWNDKPNDTPSDNQKTNDSQKNDKQTTTNKERKKEEPRKERPNQGARAADLAVQLPAGFPNTEAEAKAHAGFIGCPEDFAAKVWHRAVSRGACDSKGVLIRSFKYHLASAWSDEREFNARQQAGPAAPANETPQQRADRIFKEGL